MACSFVILSTWKKHSDRPPRAGTDARSPLSPSLTTCQEGAPCPVPRGPVTVFVLVMAPPVTQDCDVADSNGESGRRKRPSVNELASKFTDAATEAQGKRDRSESGDPAPAGKRGAVERDSPSSDCASQFNRSWKEYLENALDDMQQRVRSAISREFHELGKGIESRLTAMEDRIRDLERHVEEKDNEIVDLASELRDTRDEVRRLSDRAESAEMNSRIPCLILSGRALAPQRARLGAPLPRPADRSAPGGSAGGLAAAGRGGPAAQREGVSDRSGAERGGRVPGDRAETEVEDINGLVIGVIGARLRGLDIREEDIDRAHRLPGPNNRIIVRFVRSGPNSVRDQLMSRRMELRHHDDLFVNESLTAQKNVLYRSLLDAKKAKKIYTVFSRWGHVYFKAEKFGTSTRVDGVEKLRELGIAVKK